jgi:hypothetical protein
MNPRDRLDSYLAMSLELKVSVLPEGKTRRVY